MLLYRYQRTDKTLFLRLRFVSDELWSFYNFAMVFVFISFVLLSLVILAGNDDHVKLYSEYLLIATHALVEFFPPKIVVLLDSIVYSMLLSFFLFISRKRLCFNQIRYLLQFGIRETNIEIQHFSSFPYRNTVPMAVTRLHAFF